MIHNVFIIHESGLCLFSRTYEGNSRKIDLFSGLLAAVSSFARDLIGENIHEIRMDQHRVICEAKETVLVVLITGITRISKRKLTLVIRRIYQAFVKQYNEYLKQKIIEPQMYEGFTPTIDNILTTSGVVKKLHSGTVKRETISSIL
jgi:hypothetical protein